MATKRIGILSGTFDPIHNGHLALAQAAYEQLGLHEVWILVNGQPPGKVGVTPFAQRLAMARLAAAALPQVVVDREPVQRRTEAHSLATAQQLMHDYPDTKFTLLMGPDVFRGIDRWDGHTELLKLVEIGVGARTHLEPQETQALPALPHTPIIMPLVPVSAAQIRRSAALGEPVTGVARGVAEYIRTRRLYAK